MFSSVGSPFFQVADGEVQTTKGATRQRHEYSTGVLHLLKQHREPEFYSCRSHNCPRLSEYISIFFGILVDVRTSSARKYVLKFWNSPTRSNYFPLSFVSLRSKYLVNGTNDKKITNCPGTYVFTRTYASANVSRVKRILKCTKETIDVGWRL